MMADGGFSVEGHENIQEILSKHLILCQILCAMSILSKDGNFLCKLFDCFTLFTSSLVYLTHMCFESVGVYKPITSRPANSERYLICRGFKGIDVCATIVDHLRNMSENLHTVGKSWQFFGQQIKSIFQFVLKICCFFQAPKILSSRTYFLSFRIMKCHQRFVNTSLSQTMKS